MNHWIFWPCLALLVCAVAAWLGDAIERGIANYKPSEPLDVDHDRAFDPYRGRAS